MIKFKHINNEYLQIAALKIEEALDQLPKLMRPMTDHLKKAKGKNIRAAVMIATAQSLCGGVVNDRVIDLAVATELLHLATLIHDDVIDQAETRRGVESLQHKFGKRLAILSGNYLLTKSFRMIAENSKSRAEDFAAAAAALCIGEISQNLHNKNYAITKHQYYKIIAGKTAAMFVMAMYGAAAESGAAEITAQRLARAGYYLGMVFQMTDDLLDFEGDAAKTKKSVRQDLAQGIITYPLIHAIAVRPEIKEILKKNTMTEDDIAAVAALVRSTGGLTAARTQARIFYDRAEARIHRALPEQNTDGLMEALNLIYNRES